MLFQHSCLSIFAPLLPPPTYCPRALRPKTLNLQELETKLLSFLTVKMNVLQFFIDSGPLPDLACNDAATAAAGPPVGRKSKIFDLIGHFMSHYIQNTIFNITC